MDHNEHANHVGHGNDMNMDSTTSMGGMHMGPMHMDMMKMYFHFGTEETILFKSWKINSAWGTF